MIVKQQEGSKYPSNATVWVVSIPEGGATCQFTWKNSTYSWNDGAIVDWGDGVVEDLTPLNITDTLIPRHAYTQAGVFTIVATGMQTEIWVASRNATYGKYVTGFVRVSDTVVNYPGLLQQCSGLTQLPSNFTIPRKVSIVTDMLNSTSIVALPAGCLLHDGITDCGSFVHNTKITTLPTGFIIPDSAAAKCARVIAGNRQLVSLPDGFSFPETAIDMSQMFYAMSKFDYMPESCHIPAAATDLRSFAAIAFTKNVDIGKLFAYWNPQSENINLSGAFEASGVSGIAPADKLWNNPLSATWNVAGCFMRAFNVENFSDIPATWGGGKILFEDTTIESGTEVNAVLLEKYMNIAPFYGLYGVRVEFTGLPSGLSGRWGDGGANGAYDTYYIVGTLAAGTYTFTAHVYNKYDTEGATATITLIVDGGGSESSSVSLQVSGITDSPMADMFDFGYADGVYTPAGSYDLTSGTYTPDTPGQGYTRVWHISNSGYDYYMFWGMSDKRNTATWIISPMAPNHSVAGAPHVYANTPGDNPWDSGEWTFSMITIDNITVTQA